MQMLNSNNQNVLIVLLLSFNFFNTLFLAQNETCYLDDDIVVAVMCSNTWHIGKQVDLILKPITEYEPMTLLDLAAIHFPNGRVSANWYDGQINIYAIRIELDNVDVIENNAFNSEAFHTLDMIVLKFKNLTLIEPDAFNNLPFLEHLEMNPADIGTHFWTANSNIFAPLRKTLRFFIDKNFKGKLSDYFGDVKLSRLILILLENPMNLNIRRTLSSHNFSGLPSIESLILNKSGIESIAEHTFDYVGYTLAELHLSDNYITSLSSDLFWVFISRFSWGTKLLHLSNNPLECNCEFYELKNITVINFGDLDGQSTFFTCIERSMNSVEQCRSYQTIHANKCFLDHSDVHVYTFPQIELKYNQAISEITIKNYAKRPYRLWILNINGPQIKRKQRCPDKYWLQQSVNCLILSNSTEVIDIRTYVNESEMIIVCAAHLLRINPILLLHCIIVNNHLTGKFTTCPLLIMFICALGLAVGCCVSLIRENCKTNESTEESCEQYDYSQPAMASDGEANNIYYESVDNANSDNKILESNYVIILP